MADLTSPVPIRDWVNTYLEWFDNTTESAFSRVSYRSTLEPFADWVEGSDGHVDMHVIETFCARPRPRAPRPMPRTFNRDRNVISAMFKYLTKRRECDPVYQLEASNVDQRKVPKRVKTTAPDAQWQLTWYSDLSLDERFWLGFGYYAGLRRFEIASLRVKHFDLEARQLVNFPRKGGDECMVPYGVMTDLVVEAMPTIGRRTDEWFDAIGKVIAVRGFDPENRLCVRADDYTGSRVENQDGWINGDLERILVRVGLARNTFKPHDLRRACATNLSAVGVPPLALAEWLNHKDLSTTQLYTKHDPETIKANWLEARGL